MATQESVSDIPRLKTKLKVTTVSQEENINLPEPLDLTTLPSGDVLTHYGQTMWYVQSFEHKLKGILRLHNLIIDPEQWEEMLTSRKRPLKAVFRKLHKLLPFPGILYSFLDRMIDTRNWLAHTYLLDVSYLLQNEIGRRHVIEELKFFTQVFMAMAQCMDRFLDFLAHRAVDSYNLLEEFGYTTWDESEQDAREFMRRAQEARLSKSEEEP
jgi:hypothetical protein